MIIPHDQLTPEALHALVEEVVTRQGAVHGHSDVPVETMIRQVLTQLRTGKAVIVYDQAEEAASIVSKEDLRNQHSAEEA